MYGSSTDTVTVYESAIDDGVWSASLGSAATGTEIDITDEMKAACESLVGPVSEMMLDLLARSEPEYQEKIRNNIILTGGTALIPGLGEALEAALGEYGGGKVTVVEDPVYVGSDGGLALATEAPSSEWEKLAS